MLEPAHISLADQYHAARKARSVDGLLAVVYIGTRLAESYRARMPKFDSPKAPPQHVRDAHAAFGMKAVHALQIVRRARIVALILTIDRDATGIDLAPYECWFDFSPLIKERFAAIASARAAGDPRDVEWHLTKLRALVDFELGGLDASDERMRIRREAARG